ncbi:MAG: response regulator [Xanthobacteraceae bacterium]|nr:response regulator [Xanthobacteraceae bacterium]
MKSFYPSSHPSSALPNDVLVVEDDPLIALDFAETIREIGVVSVRTASGAAHALEMIVERGPDFAFLDVELMSERSFAVAERLEVLAIPFAFVTAHSGVPIFPERFLQKPILPKPYARDTLEAILWTWRKANVA